MTDARTKVDWIALVDELGPKFGKVAAVHDSDDSFVAENYAELKRHKVFSAGVPAELGGGGATHAELCDIVRHVGRHCSSTALALSMHTHPLAANVFRFRRGQPAEAMLRKVAAEELVICGTGANDWLGSSGTMRRVEGGYRVDAVKHFVSGSPGADLFVTSSVFDDPAEGAQVLHFAVPMRSEGVALERVWKTIGMRGTGSEDVVLSDVFVPEAAITVRRPAGTWHPVWNVILPIAMPIIMSAYVGIAEAAASIGRAQAKGHDDGTLLALGELENALTTARLAHADMVARADDYSFTPDLALTNAVLVRKTIVAKACIATVDAAMGIASGRGFFRGLGLERLFRDVRAAHFHPLPERKQQIFSGRVALELDPVS
jgi:alkylation response protein AidB-like acyl-CoA dehydrogenase